MNCGFRSGIVFCFWKWKNFFILLWHHLFFFLLFLFHIFCMRGRWDVNIESIRNSQRLGKEVKSNLKKLYIVFNETQRKKAGWWTMLEYDGEKKQGETMLSINSDTRRRVEALEKRVEEEFEWKTIGRQQAHCSVCWVGKNTQVKLKLNYGNEWNES